MATQTQHFNLTKPDWEDRASISVLNANTDIIDAQMYDNEQSAANAIGNMAAEYDDTATYEVGDFCIYSEVLYKCVTAVSVAEAFDSTKWTQTKAAENFGSGGGGGSATLAGLNDVNLTSPTDGQALVYDGANGKWTNGGVVGEGGSSIYFEKQLYKATSNTFQDIVVSWNWADYDAYIFAVHDIHLTASIKQNGDTTYFTKEQIENVIADGKKQFFYRASNYATYTFSDVEITAQNNTGDFFITEIIGLRFGTLSPIIYSEEEREVGVWTDGKPLYQKTYYLANASNTTYTLEASFDADIKINAGSWLDASGYKRPIPYQQSDGSVFPYSRNSVLYLQFSPSNATNVSVTILYTKTTDTAGSGTWTTTGEYAHHYSTTEQVVGTWIDGKPLYERAFLQTTFSANANTWYKTAIPRGSMKYLIDVFVVFESATVPSVHKGMSGGFIDDYLAINSFRNIGIDAGETGYVVAQYTKTTD